MVKLVPQNSPNSTLKPTKPRMFRFTPASHSLTPFSGPRPVSFRHRFHVHEDHEINIAVKGSGRYIMGDGSSYAFGMGQMLLIPGGIVHRLEVDEEMDLRGLCLHPEIYNMIAPISNGDPIFERLSSYKDPLKPKVIYEPQIFQSMVELFEQAQQEQAQSEPVRSICLKYMGAVVAIQMLRLFQMTENIPPNAVAKRIAATEIWMNRHFAQATTVAELSDMAGLSPPHFAALFKKQYLISPKAYMIKRRLDHAAMRLAQTKQTVLEIAFDTGFNHLAHFNRSFKEVYGFTPTEYRRKHQRNHGII